MKNLIKIFNVTIEVKRMSRWLILVPGYMGGNFTRKVIHRQKTRIKASFPSISDTGAAANHSARCCPRGDSSATFQSPR